jgi:hypothetical protein
MIIDHSKDHITKGDCDILMDNISIASGTKKEYGYHVRAVIDTLQKNNFCLKEKKYFFKQAKTKFVE